MDTLKRQARIAGLFYLVVLVAAPVGYIFIPGQIIVSGDAAATAERIRAAESLMRVGLASEVVLAIFQTLAALALYRLFRGIDDFQAKVMLTFGALVSVPVMLVCTAFESAALVVLSTPGYLSAFDPAQLEGMAYLFLRMHGEGLDLAAFFWGLWLFPMGFLAIRSGFVPRVVGWLVIAGGIGHVVNATTLLLWPDFAGAVEKVTMVLYFGEVSIILWLVIWGARGPRAAADVSRG